MELACLQCYDYVIKALSRVWLPRFCMWFLALRVVTCLLPAFAVVKGRRCKPGRLDSVLLPECLSVAGRPTRGWDVSFLLSESCRYGAVLSSTVPGVSPR
jgi:hypothetical protein